jgi:hypothetical protein
MNWLKKFWKALREPPPAKVTPMGAPSPTRTQTTPKFAEQVGETMCNFTPRAQQVLSLARKEADRFYHNFVGTEHLLLGLIALGQGTAVNVLRKLGLDLENVRMEVEKQVGSGPNQKMIGYIPHTPRVKKVLALATKEARGLNHTYVGTEHILLGLLREGDGVAARVLKSFHVDVEATRQEILRELDPNFALDYSKAQPSPPQQTVSEQPDSRSAFPKTDPIDTSKRYDVHCTERNQEVVVYRNAVFKGVRTLYQRRQYDFSSEFIELEQQGGQIMFVSRSSVIKFCEHNTKPDAGTGSGKET